MKPSTNPLNPMQRDSRRLQAAPRCSATSKRTGCSCRAPAVRGWTVCRFHGARGGAPKGKGNGRFVHGTRSAEAVALRRHVRDLVQEASALIASRVVAPK